MVALMKRLSLSAEDKERSAAVSEIVDLVKKGGVAALKVCPFILLSSSSPCITSFVCLGVHAVGLSPLCARRIAGRLKRVFICLHTPASCQGGALQLTCCAPIFAGWWSRGPPV